MSFRAVRFSMVCVCLEHDMNGEETKTWDPDVGDVQRIVNTNGAFPCDLDTGRCLRRICASRAKNLLFVLFLFCVLRKKSSHLNQERVIGMHKRECVRRIDASHTMGGVIIFRQLVSVKSTNRSHKRRICQVKVGTCRIKNKRCRRILNASNHVCLIHNCRRVA
jgi:hypothetical protein